VATAPDNLSEARCRKRRHIGARPHLQFLDTRQQHDDDVTVAAVRAGVEIL